MNKKVLVTGANGLLGQKLVKKLLEKGYQVLATSTGDCRIESLKGFEYESLDITSEEQVKSVLGKFKPNYIINSAAMTNVDACEDEQEKCHDINVKGVSYLLSQAIELNAYFLQISTDFIFDGQKDGLYTEEDEPNPLGYYGQSKLDSEKIILNSSHKKYAIARTTLVYGVYENMTRGNIVLWAKGALENQQPMNVIDDQYRTPTLADDLADGCILLMEKEGLGVYNVSGDDYMNIREVVSRIAKYYHFEEDNVHTIDSSTLNQKAMRPAKSGFDLTKIKQLGYQPHSFEDCLKIIDEQLLELASN